jgi:hypothetical protein
MAAVLLVVTFLSWAWAALLLPFVNILPYLQRFTFAERLPFSAALFCVAAVVAKVAAPEVWRSWVNSGRKEVLALLAATAFTTFAAAMLNANSLGSLAWLVPGEPYSQSFTISGVSNRGSKYRSVELQLQSSVGKRSLVLSKRLFHYPHFSVGQSILLRGKSTVFGVYVERFEVQ